MDKKNSSHFKKGQVILFVIVIITVALIITSSIVTRSLTGVRTTSVNTDSDRALNTAEAGIEELLNKSPSELIALIGSNKDISVQDKNLFNEAKFKVENATGTYLQTPSSVPEDTILQVEFSGNPGNLQVHFQGDACVVVSAYNTVGNVSRTFTCPAASGTVSGSGYSSATQAVACPTFDSITYAHCTPTFSISGTPAMILIKILGASSPIRVSAGDFAAFKTKYIKGTSWAVTKTNVRKEVEVTTKTTKDPFPVFDYALYIK